MLPKQIARRCGAYGGRNVTHGAAPKDDPLIGTTIGDKYRIIDRIGVGAMGTIYRAEQTALDKILAVKILHRHLLADPSLPKRFHREARMAARITHPHCITIHDFGNTSDGLLYIAMEFIDGRDLAQLVFEEHPLDTDRVVRICKQVCSALDAAHSSGVIHRDLKPENIMVTRIGGEDDFVKVLDFGIAKPQDRNSPAESFQTMAGIVCGTPEYMSPEQARGEELDARSDLYALGVVMYHMVTNSLPFSGDSPLSVVTKHLMEPPKAPKLINPGVPDALNALILQLLAKKRDQRPPTALALKKQLERLEMTLGQANDTMPAEGQPAPLRAAKLTAPSPGPMSEPRTETATMPNAGGRGADARSPSPVRAELRATPPRPSLPEPHAEISPRPASRQRTPVAARDAAPAAAPPAPIAPVTPTKAPPAASALPESLFDTIPDEAEATVIVQRPTKATFDALREAERARHAAAAPAAHVSQDLIDTVREAPSTVEAVGPKRKKGVVTVLVLVVLAGIAVAAAFALQ
jgi:serine/threonine-protein kinase